jgi:hypothetical protein
MIYYISDFRNTDNNIYTWYDLLYIGYCNNRNTVLHYKQYYTHTCTIIYIHGMIYYIG